MNQLSVLRQQTTAMKTSVWIGMLTHLEGAFPIMGRMIKLMVMKRDPKGSDGKDTDMIDYEETEFEKND